MLSEKFMVIKKVTILETIGFYLKNTSFSLNENLECEREISAQKQQQPKQKQKQKKTRNILGIISIRYRQWYLLKTMVNQWKSFLIFNYFYFLHCLCFHDFPSINIHVFHSFSTFFSANNCLFIYLFIFLIRHYTLATMIFFPEINL